MHKPVDRQTVPLSRCQRLRAAAAAADAYNSCVMQLSVAAANRIALNITIGLIESLSKPCTSNNTRSYLITFCSKEQAIPASHDIKPVFRSQRIILFVNRPYSTNPSHRGVYSVV
jgi:hypothetical protein